MTTLWDGAAATNDQLEFLGLSSYGCYTFFQARRKSVHGLGLHLDRLRANSQELFGAAPAESRLRELLDHAIPDEPCSARVTVVSQDVAGVLSGSAVVPEVVVTVSAPKDPSSEPISARTVEHLRETPTVKHRATYGLTRLARAAQQAGFDDALFVNKAACLTEGTTWNLLLHTEDTWLWPEAEVLNGVTMQLLSRAMSDQRVPQVRRPVPIAELEPLRAGFAVNASSHSRPISRIDGYDLSGATRAAAQLEELWQSIAPEPL